MLKRFIFSLFVFTIILMVLIFVSLGFSQQDLAQQAYAIIDNNCLICHPWTFYRESRDPGQSAANRHRNSYSRKP